MPVTSTPPPPSSDALEGGGKRLRNDTSDPSPCMDCALNAINCDLARPNCGACTAVCASCVYVGEDEYEKVDELLEGGKRTRVVEAGKEEVMAQIPLSAHAHGLNHYVQSQQCWQGNYPRFTSYYGQPDYSSYYCGQGHDSSTMGAMPQSNTATVPPITQQPTLKATKEATGGGTPSSLYHFKASEKSIPTGNIAVKHELLADEDMPAVVATAEVPSRETPAMPSSTSSGSVSLTLDVDSTLERLNELMDHGLFKSEVEAVIGRIMQGEDINSPAVRKAIQDLMGAVMKHVPSPQDAKPPPQLPTTSQRPDIEFLPAEFTTPPGSSTEATITTFIDPSTPKQEGPKPKKDIKTKKKHSFPLRGDPPTEEFVSRFMSRKEAMKAHLVTQALAKGLTLSELVIKLLPTVREGAQRRLTCGKLWIVNPETTQRCYICPACEKEYSTANGLKYHLGQHNFRDFPEGYYWAKKKDALDRPNDIVQPYSCSVPNCLRKYTSYGGLKYHMVHAHGLTGVPATSASSSRDHAVNGSENEAPIMADSAVALNMIEMELSGESEEYLNEDE
ncbi:hypothetical protein BC830DRAFT_1218438 [Chytriomyces sp. MP71]|nr:hypothetical protein BC830DRAFT_1218438 [Chytriomyces sp. MP71]